MGILSVSNYSILPSIAGGLGVSFNISVNPFCVPSIDVFAVVVYTKIIYLLNL